MTKFRLVLALLALSLIFNIFFVIGALGQRPRRGPIAAITQAARELQLDSQQSARFGELRADYRDEAALIGQELHEVRRAIAEQLDADSTDSEALAELMQQESDLIAQRRRTATQHFGHFVDLLTPNQRHNLGRRMHPQRDRGERPADPPQVVARFDADGDGELSETERDEAHRQMAGRRERHFKWRAEMREKFDADQSGRLDAEEREAMRAWMLEQGSEPPPHDGLRDGPRSGPRGDQPGRGNRRPPRHGPGPNGGPPPIHTPPPSV